MSIQVNAPPARHAHPAGADGHAAVLGEGLRLDQHRRRAAGGQGQQRQPLPLLSRQAGPAAGGARHVPRRHPRHAARACLARRRGADRADLRPARALPRRARRTPTASTAARSAASRSSCTSRTWRCASAWRRTSPPGPTPSRSASPRPPHACPRTWTGASSPRFVLTVMEGAVMQARTYREPRKLRRRRAPAARLLRVSAGARRRRGRARATPRQDTQEQAMNNNIRAATLLGLASLAALGARAAPEPSAPYAAARLPRRPLLAGHLPRRRRRPTSTASAGSTAASSCATSTSCTATRRRRTTSASRSTCGMRPRASCSTCTSRAPAASAAARSRSRATTLVFPPTRYVEKGVEQTYRSRWQRAASPRVRRGHRVPGARAAAGRRASRVHMQQVSASSG